MSSLGGVHLISGIAYCILGMVEMHVFISFFVFVFVCLFVCFLNMHTYWKHMVKTLVYTEVTSILKVGKV